MGLQNIDMDASQLQRMDSNQTMQRILKIMEEYKTFSNGQVPNFESFVSICGRGRNIDFKDAHHPANSTSTNRPSVSSDDKSSGNNIIDRPFPSQSCFQSCPDIRQISPQSQTELTAQKASMNSPPAVGVIGQKPYGTLQSRSTPGGALRRHWKSDNGLDTQSHAFKATHPRVQVHVDYSGWHPQGAFQRVSLKERQHPPGGLSQQRPILGCNQDLPTSSLSNDQFQQRHSVTPILSRDPLCETVSPQAPIYNKMERLQHDRTSWIYCDICDKKVNSEYQFTIHVEGKKHKQLAENIKLANQAPIVSCVMENSFWNVHRNRRLKSFDNFSSGIVPTIETPQLAINN